jgi:hypothetical protein
MSFDLNSIKKERTRKAPRILLLGVEKIGKSSFAAGSPNPIFLPIKGEEGIDDLEVSKFPVAQTYEDVIQAIKTLANEKHEFKTLVIDSASALEPVIWDEVCREARCDSIEKVGGGYGKGYLESLYKWRKLMEGIDILRQKSIGCILIGHVKVKVFNDPLGNSYDQYSFDINEKVNASISRWADSILFGNARTIVKTEEVGFNKEKKIGKDPTGERYLYTQKKPGHPGGGRGIYGRLPYEIKLNWEDFSSEVLKLSENTNNK